MQLMGDPKDLHVSPKLLIHKISIIKQTRKLWKQPCNYNEKYEKSCLLYNSINTRINTILSLNEEFVIKDESDIKDKKLYNRAFLHYLETLTAKFPRNSLIKLYLIFFYMKKFRFYWKAIKTINDLQRGNNHTYIFLNVELLIHQAKTAIRSQRQDNNTNRLDLDAYIHNQAAFMQVKKDMLNQAQQQVELCNEIGKDEPDLGKIFAAGQTIQRSRCIIEKRITSLVHTLPEYFVEPIMLFSHYYGMLNHSVGDSSVYRKLYNIRRQKYDKHFKEKHLVNENVYQDTNVFIIISAQKTDSENIVYCSKSIEKLFGGQIHNYIDTRISTLALPTLQPFYASIFSDIIEHGDTSLLKTIDRFYGYHRDDGHLVETELQMSINPDITQGLYYYIALRPAASNNECLVLNENGDVGFCSAKINERLECFHPQGSPGKKRVNVRLISDELYTANEAFNVVAFPEDYTAKDQDIPIDDYDSIPMNSIEVSQKTITKGKNMIKTFNFIHKKQTLAAPKRSKLTADEASDIYSSYMNGGRSIELELTTPFNKESMNSNPSYNYGVYIYNCKIFNLSNNSITDENCHAQRNSPAIQRAVHVWDSATD